MKTVSKLMIGLALVALLALPAMAVIPFHCDPGEYDHLGDCVSDCQAHGGNACQNICKACTDCNSNSDCTDGNICTTDTCHKVAGPNHCDSANNANACNDGNACTQTDVCSAGTCVGSNPVVCSNPFGDCGAAGTCNTGTGLCSAATAFQEGTTCDGGLCDGLGECVECIIDDDCTEGFHCADNVCTGDVCGVDFQCDAGYQCADNACVPIPGYCDEDTDCPEGYVCYNNECILTPGTCKGDRDCNPWQMCADGRCTDKQYGCELDIYAKNPATWQKITGGASATMVFDASSFHVVGEGLDPSTGYDIIYYPDPWPGTGLMILGATITDESGNLNTGGFFDFNAIPIAGDTNTGAKIWVVPVSDAGGGQMTAWNPTKYLFEERLIKTPSGGLCGAVEIIAQSRSITPYSEPACQAVVGSLRPMDDLDPSTLPMLDLKNTWIAATFNYASEFDCVDLAYYTRGEPSFSPDCTTVEWWNRNQQEVHAYGGMPLLTAPVPAQAICVLAVKNTPTENTLPVTITLQDSHGKTGDVITSSDPVIQKCYQLPEDFSECRLRKQD